MKNQGDGSIFYTSHSRESGNLTEKTEPSPLFSNRIGQSILELAILGTILIGILGLVVNYGLRYNYQQKVMMQAFRNAYNAAPEGGSYALVVDKHIPDPSDPWGVGSVTPISASASVTRDYKMQEIAVCDEDDVNVCNTSSTYTVDLPKTTIEIKGSSGSKKYSFTTSGFRDAGGLTKATGGLTPEQVDKYEEIYGASSVCSDPDQGCGAREGECINPIVNPDTGEETCEDRYLKIRILDPCEGESVSADTIRRICYLINNTAACKNDCTRAGEDDCSSCDQNIPSPWYCSAESILFPPDKFPISSSRSMGIGIKYGQTSNINNILNKSGSSITDNVDWNRQTNRKIFYKSGHGVATIEVPTEVSQSDNWDWE